jgi:hypothetical protein
MFVCHFTFKRERSGRSFTLPVTKKPHAYEKNTLHWPNMSREATWRLREGHLKIPFGRKILLRSWNEPHAPTCIGYFL